jgi:hypothetical protein
MLTPAFVLVCTHHARYDAAASDNSGPIFGNETFPATVDYDTNPCIVFAGTPALCNVPANAALCPATCGVTYNLTKIDIPDEGTIITTSATGTASSFFRPTGATDTIGTDCEPFAIKFACYDGNDVTNTPLPAVYTDYASFNGARMLPQAASGSALAHILSDTLVVVHNGGLPLPTNLRCEIEGPRELCFGPPIAGKGEARTNLNNEEHTLCPPEAGEVCFGLSDQASCDVAAESECVWVVADSACMNNWPCSGREITLGAPGVRSCGVPGLHDLGFTTDGTTSVHSTRPYLSAPSECDATDMFYSDEGCTGYGIPYETCNVENTMHGDVSLDPDSLTPPYWDYTQQGAFLPTGCCAVSTFKPSLGTSLYLDHRNQLDNGVPAGVHSFLNYFGVHTTGGTNRANMNSDNVKVGPVSLAGLLPSPANAINLQSGCAFGLNPTCDTTYANRENEGAFNTPRVPLLRRTHFGGQGSGICYPVQGSTGVPFGTNGVDDYNTFLEKSLPSTYNPWFKQVRFSPFFLSSTLHDATL